MKQFPMHDLVVNTVSSMNYLFLRVLTGKITEDDAQYEPVVSEVSQFLTGLNTSLKDGELFSAVRDTIRAELGEGDYMGDVPGVIVEKRITEWCAAHCEETLYHVGPFYRSLYESLKADAS